MDLLRRDRTRFERTVQEAICGKAMLESPHSHAGSQCCSRKRKNEKMGQNVITKRGNVLGHRKRGFDEMDSEMHLGQRRRPASRANSAKRQRLDGEGLNRTVHVMDVNVLRQATEVRMENRDIPMF